MEPWNPKMEMPSWAHDNPFASANPAGRWVQVRGARDRVERVKLFNEQECRQALELGGLQKAVTEALERRLRKLRQAAMPV